MKIRRETQALKQGRCFIRCCSAAALCERGSQEMGCSGAAAALAVVPGGWLLCPLPPLLSPSYCSSSDSFSACTHRVLGFEGGRVVEEQEVVPAFVSGGLAKLPNI